MTLQKKFSDHLCKTYPQLKTLNLDDLISENLISPFDIQLPTAILDQARNFIAAAFELREKKEYLSNYASNLDQLKIIDPKNKSIMMSYDFHVDPSGDLKLIEINTNSSFLLLGLELYKMKNLPLPVPNFSHQSIEQMILEELELFGSLNKKPYVVISDETPQQQRLFIEFLAYNELFKSFGWKSEIQDYKDLFKDNNPDFIYNRFTDFMLAEKESHILLNKFLQKEVCLSPNPFEYFLLADKQRLIDWSAPLFLEKMNLSKEQIETIRKNCPQAFEINSKNKDEIWSIRKNLFIKPKHAFGSKLSYKGSSISRKHFDLLDLNETIAQEYVPAAEKVFETPDGPQSFKYDLRCYAYQGQLQLIVARLYQGQVTNLRTQWGGFACVLFD